MTDIMPRVKIKTKGDISGIMRNVNDNKTMMNNVHLPHLKAKKVQWLDL